MRLHRLKRRWGLPGILGILGLVMLGAAAWVGAGGPPSAVQPQPVIPLTHLPSLMAVTSSIPPLAPAARSTLSVSNQAASPVAAGEVTELPRRPDHTQPAPTPTSPPHLMIPSIGLAESILTIPVVNGNWDISQLDTHIGWLSTTGMHPGDALAMAFIGHYTISAGRKGALGDVWHLQPADDVIYESGGVDYIYAIRNIETIAPTEVKKLYVNDGRQLLLVTCANWDDLAFRYTNRVIVQARLVKQELVQ